MEAETFASLLALALGHDQEAAACPWVQLTARTSEYPSRKAQAIVALSRGELAVTPDLVDLLYRCDDCGICRAWSTLPSPPDLPRAQWAARAALVELGAVPEVEPLRANLRAHGNLHGDLTAAQASLGTGDAEASALFVPGAAVLAHQPEAAAAALNAARSSLGRVAVMTGLLDSGQSLIELGLEQEAREAQAKVRRQVEEAGHRLVIAGTPKEAWALGEVLAGSGVEVAYVGSLLAKAALDGRVRLREDAGLGLRAVLHPSEALLHRLPDWDRLERWMDAWLGQGGRVCEPDPRRSVWPAALERPAIRLPESLRRGLARRRLETLMKLEPAVILTCDPFSRAALREVAPPTVEVVDLIEFAARHW